MRKIVGLAIALFVLSSAQAKSQDALTSAKDDDIKVATKRKSFLEPEAPVSPEELRREIKDYDKTPRCINADCSKTGYMSYKTHKIIPKTYP
jgi:hypothetical protein